MPYYKFKKHKVEMDFGGFLQEIIYGLLCISFMKKIVFVLFGCLIIFQSCSNVFYNHANKTEKVTVKVKPFK